MKSINNNLDPLPSGCCYVEGDWSPVRTETVPGLASGISADSPVAAVSYASSV